MGKKLENLGYFTGTVEKYRAPFPAPRDTTFTDGVHYVMEYATWLVTDIFAQLMANPKLKGVDFMLIVFTPERNGKCARVEYKDDNYKVLEIQEYSIADLDDEVEFYFIDDISVKTLLLRSEY